MKIAFINNFYNYGGTRTSYELAKSFGINNEMRFYGCVDGEYRDYFSKIGETFLFPFNPNLSYEKHLIEELINFEPDVIHAFIPGKESLSFLSGFTNKAIRIVTVLNDETIGFNHHEFDHTIFSSQYQKQTNDPITNSSVIRPSISMDLPQSKQKEIATFGRISSFCPTKKIQDTVSCAAEVNNQFYISGEIQRSRISKEYYRSIVAYSNKVANNVLVSNNINEKQKAELLNNIDVIHHPSKNETLCFSMLEGFAMKKPVITYSNSALLEIMGDSEWACSDINDLKEKTIKMSTLSATERQEIGERNYKEYTANKSEIYHNQVMDIYKKYAPTLEVVTTST